MHVPVTSVHVYIRIRSPGASKSLPRSCAARFHHMYVLGYPLYLRPWGGGDGFSFTSLYCYRGRSVTLCKNFSFSYDKCDPTVVPDRPVYDARLCIAVGWYDKWANDLVDVVGVGVRRKSSAFTNRVDAARLRVVATRHEWHELRYHESEGGRKMILPIDCSLYLIMVNDL